MKDFIREIIDADNSSGRHGGRIETRFPPEPNGYLHIGHAKAICLDFGVAKEYGGECHLRFDDTNPITEDVEYVDSIMEDVRWLGFDWGKHLYYASDYFQQMHDYAVELIQAGRAYVDHLSQDEIREYRGTLTEPGRESPHRNRSIEENLELFGKMRAGEMKDGECVLRAKIDMAHPNVHMRDPALYRIKHAKHHRTGDKWCIYPMYDFAHSIEDAMENITHSLCTLEFEVHRPLYNWVLENISTKSSPRQIEFARLELTYTVLSKRKLLKLVEGGLVSGWDDPRMPTLSGMRRRGYPPEAIRAFCERIGVAKTNSTVDIGLLEHCVREDLNKRARRVMAVIDPLKVTITNYPEGKTEEIEIENNQEDPSAGTRKIPFSRNIYIDRNDFMEEPPKKFFRLSPGKEVRLKRAYYVTCEEVIKDGKTGEVKELLCRYDPESRGGETKDNRKVKGTIHWVPAEHAVDAEIRLYGHLFTGQNPDDAPEGGDFTSNINPDSLKVLTGCKVEPSLAAAAPGEYLQLMRHGYFCADASSTGEKPVFNRTVTLRDSWKKIEDKSGRNNRKKK